MTDRSYPHLEKGEFERMQLSSAKVEPALQNLAANLMRVARGAGDPHRLVWQMTMAIAAFDNYAAEKGHSPSADTLHRLLSIPRPSRPAADHDERVLDSRIDAVVSGALQVAASRLLGQASQEAAGTKEILNAARAMRS